MIDNSFMPPSLRPISVPFQALAPYPASSPSSAHDIGAISPVSTISQPPMTSSTTTTTTYSGLLLAQLSGYNFLLSENFLFIFLLI